MNMLEEAKKVDGQKFNDGQNYCAMLKNGEVVRCYSQDGAETVVMQGNSGVKFVYKSNYVAATKNGEIIGLIWPQN